jgi:hypothetical protein
MRLGMTQTEADALAARFIHFLETGEADPELFSAGVFCDFTLPRWRLASPRLGEHLAESLRTGTHCCYAPRKH